MSKWHFLAVAAALCCGAVNAADLASGAEAVTSSVAVAPAGPVTLQEYLRIVVQNQPNLAADRMQLDLARADSKTAATISNPAMHYSSKRGEKEWGVEQAIPIFGQRGMRIENARLGEKAAAANADVAVAVTMSDAAHAFNELLVAQQRYQVWLAARDELDVLATKLALSDTATPSPAAVPTTQAQPLQKGIFLQLGAFSNADNAENLRLHLARELDWLNEGIQVNAGNGMHRVHLGPYTNRSDAEKIAEKIRLALGYKPSYVTR